MKRLIETRLREELAAQHGVISRATALGMGISPRQVDWLLATGRWELVHRGVYAAGGTAGPEARLLAACLAAGESAVASHRSAAWLWGLRSESPDRPAVTVIPPRDPRLGGIELHRRRDLDPGRLLVRRGIPLTDPLRTLADLGEVAGDRELDDAVDRALAARLLGIDALEAEIARLSRPGKRGAARLRRAIERRGMVEAPNPSVLESRVLRLLRRWGVAPVGVEVVVAGGRYRLDVLLREGVALEVDGYAFHWSPEAKAADSRRRNELRLAGITVIEADWVTVMREPHHLRATVRAALRLPRDSPGRPPRTETGAGSHRSTGSGTSMTPPTGAAGWPRRPLDPPREAVIDAALTRPAMTGTRRPPPRPPAAGTTTS